MTRAHRIGLVVLLAGGLALSAPPASANGLTTHTWITLQAIEHVPPGPLRDLVTSAELRDPMISGTIFPDGGYAIGDGYGELAHWEPFQHRYLSWIRAHYAPPWSDEAKRHIAFLLGLSSHGMADQVFDSLYMARAHVYDAASNWEQDSMDEATDVIMASRFGPQRVPMRFVPVDALIPLFADAGHTVDEKTILQGHNLAGFAVAIVGMLAQDRDAVRSYKAKFPWATAHLEDEAVPGTPMREAEIVALYWQRIWDRLNAGLAASDVVISTVPASGALGHERVSSSMDARISIIFSRRLFRRDVGADRFRITDAGGAALPFRAELYYGDDSHVVHLIPTEDLAAETDYTVSVLPGLPTAEGAPIEGLYTFQVSTRKAPAAAPGSVEEGGGCACAGRPAGALGPGLTLGLAGLLSSLRRRGRR